MKYKRVKKTQFCGKAGGRGARSYPVNTRKRCIAALSYARYAPKPCGIAKCVRKKCKKYNVGKSSKLMKRCTKRKTKRRKTIRRPVRHGKHKVRAHYRKTRIGRRVRVKGYTRKKISKRSKRSRRRNINRRNFGNFCGIY